MGAVLGIALTIYIVIRAIDQGAPPLGVVILGAVSLIATCIGVLILSRIRIE